MSDADETKNSNGAGCIFCKIVAGEIPSHKVYETDDFLAFLDIHPHAPGHVQVIPKKHFRWVWDLPAQAGVPNGFDIGEYFRVVQKVALAQRKAFETEWIISRIVGDEVPHAHIWIFPGDGKGDPTSQQFLGASKNDLVGNAEKIREVLKNM